MSLAQDLRNAWDARDRNEFERLLTKLPTSVYAVPACSHPNQTFSDGPTTNQRNHWCPDCHATWTSFPDHASQAVMAASLGKPCTHQLLMTSGSAHGPSHARCLSCGKDMSNEVHASQAVMEASIGTGCGNPHCGGKRVDGECGMKHQRQRVFMGHCLAGSHTTPSPNMFAHGTRAVSAGGTGEPGNQSNLPDHHSV